MWIKMIDIKAFILYISLWHLIKQNFVDGSFAVVNETQFRPYKGELYGTVHNTVHIPVCICVYTAELTRVFEKVVDISH